MDIDGAVNKSNQGGSSFFVLSNGQNPDVAADFLTSTFGGNADLYDTLLSQANIMGTYLPASEVAAYDDEDEFFSNQQVNGTLASWIPEIPAVETGSYSSEAQAAILAVMPDILNGADVQTSLAAAEEQFAQMIQ